MKADISLVTRRLAIRHWEERDRPFFHRINSDPQVMAFFPVRRKREEADVMMDSLAESLRTNGLGWAAVTLRNAGYPIGFAGLAKVNFEAAFTPAVEIGWRLAPEFWGKGYATEAAEELLRHGFADLGLHEIVSFAVPNNTRSIAIMKRIGMTAEPALDFDHPRVPDSHPHLKRHVFYRIQREEWGNQRAAI